MPQCHWEFRKYRRAVEVHIWVGDLYTVTCIEPNGTRGPLGDLPVQWANAELHRMWREWWIERRAKDPPPPPTIREQTDNPWPSDADERESKPLKLYRVDAERHRE